MANPCIEAAEEELKAAGVRYEVEQGGKHVRIRYGDQLQHCHFTSLTPSDHRAPENSRHQIRRDLVRLGYVVKEDAAAPADVPLKLVDGAPCCFSYDIAENFDKPHKTVLRAIDNVRDECGPEFDRHNFAPIEYADEKGRKYRAYRMTRDGFSLVVMGFTGSKAMGWKVKYVEAFNAMEAELNRLSGSGDVSRIEGDMDAMFAVIADLETRIQKPANGYVHPRQSARIAGRRERRRARA